jgi:hypothetical protein
VKLRFATAAIPSVLFLSACGAAGPSKTVTRTIELDAAKAVTVELNMAAGELRVAGGSTRLVDGSFTFNVPDWEPKVEYTNNGDRGALAIRQGSGSTSFRNSKNEWDLKLNDAVPISLTASVGAGEGRMTLGSLTLERVQVDAGAGEFTLDLRGTPKHSYDVHVNASVGQTNVRLPKAAAIVATASATVGGVNVSGLVKQGTNTWINPGHEQDPVTIHVEVKGGVGQIEISAE